MLQQGKNRLENALINQLFSHQLGLMNFTLMCEKEVFEQPQKHQQLPPRSYGGWRDIPENKANVMLTFFLEKN